MTNGLAAAASVAVLSLCCLTSAHAQPSTDAAPKLGYGFDDLTGRRTPGRCVSYTEADIHSEGNAFNRLDLISSSISSLTSTVQSEDLSLSAAARLGLGSYSASFSRSALRSSSASTLEQYLEVELSVGLATQQIDSHGVPLLVSDLSNLADEAFLQDCGTRYVVSEQKGGRLHIRFSFSSTTDEGRQSISDAINAAGHYAGQGFSAGFESSFASVQQRADVRISIQSYAEGTTRQPDHPTDFASVMAYAEHFGSYVTPDQATTIQYSLVNYPSHSASNQTLLDPLADLNDQAIGLERTITLIQQNSANFPSEELDGTYLTHPITSISNIERFRRKIHTQAILCANTRQAQQCDPTALAAEFGNFYNDFGDGLTFVSYNGLVAGFRPLTPNIPAHSAARLLVYGNEQCTNSRVCPQSQYYMSQVADYEIVDLSTGAHTTLPGHGDINIPAADVERQVMVQFYIQGSDDPTIKAAISTSDPPRAAVEVLSH
jgi:hypothetical protein